jgi:ATP-binding cassette subfamily B protein
MAMVSVLNLVMPALLGWVVDVALTPLSERTAEIVSLPRWLPGASWVEVWALSVGREIIFWAAIVLLAIGLVRVVFAFLLTYYGAWLGTTAAYDLRNEYFQHIQHLSFAFHDRSQTGDLMSRAITDIQKVRQFLGEGLLESINIPVLFALVAWAMFRLDAGLAVIAMLPLFVLMAVTLRFGKIIEPRFKAVQDQEGTISALAQENFSGARVVKAFANEPLETERFAEANHGFYERRVEVIAGFADYFPAMTAIAVLASGIVLLFGGRMVLAGDMTVGTLVSFNFYVIMLAAPAQNLGFLVNRTGEAVAGGRRLYEILDTASDIAELPGATSLPPAAGSVTFDDVSFAYHDQLVLRDVSFDVLPNTVVALFGPTGSGKSTVVNLIPRFYDVTSGAVRVDGMDVRDVTLDSLRRQIATVLQDTFLFSATIRDNIAYGRGGADEEAVVAAAKAARAHEFILELPEGYETVIGERGVNLSGGQRQRIAIARALLMEPRILILDDATSAVDTETEHQIQQALGELMTGRTTFIIAQRLLTLKRADLILVMDGGQVVERGSHDALVAAGGLYSRVYDLQLRDQETLAREAAHDSALGGEDQDESHDNAAPSDEVRP